jgi:hypothetical protein
MNNDKASQVLLRGLVANACATNFTPGSEGGVAGRSGHAR